MGADTMRLDPVTRHVRGLDGDFYLPREAAKVLGISVDRLKALGRRFPDTLGPGYVSWLGDLKVYLYDDGDIAAVRDYFAKLDAQRPVELSPYRNGRGRPPVWSHDEHASRHRRRALRTYHARMAARCAAQGRAERAETYRRRAEALSSELDAELAARRAELHPAPSDDGAVPAAG